ncbi:Glycosyltransferase family 9 (heptosyltransferase) [uncultured archaeon]|nr:Glycosyltransferase family 9 (heptosyltransferase) [uncultured archaeon]
MTGVGKILYVPPRGIGDLVFSLPLLHSLHDAMPLADIEIPIPDRVSVKQMIDLIGFVKPCGVFLPKPSEDPLADERWVAAKAGDSKKRYAAEKKIFEKYLSGSYDLAVVAKPFKIDSIQATQVSRNELRAMGFDWKKAHMVDGFSAFATYLGIPSSNSFNLVFDRSTDVKLSDGSIPRVGSRYVIFNLGASDSAKKWGCEKYAKVSEWLNNQGVNSVLVGTPDEYQDSQVIARDGKGIVNLVSSNGYSLDLRNYAVLASRASVAVSGDTGLLHIADAVGTKVVGLYGTTSPDKTGPYNNRQNVVSRYNSDKDLSKITEAEVIKTLEGLL